MYDGSAMAKNGQQPQQPKKRRGFAEGPGYCFRVSGRATKAEEMDFYRRTGNGPVAIYYGRPRPEAPQGAAPEAPKPPQDAAAEPPKE
jgi:hypothetical protein